MPTAQSSQLAASAELNWPALHVSHDCAASAEKNPGPQVSQNGRPGMFANLPGSHRKQVVLSAVLPERYWPAAQAAHTTSADVLHLDDTFLPLSQVEHESHERAVVVSPARYWPDEQAAQEMSEVVVHADATFVPALQLPHDEQLRSVLVAPTRY